MIDRRSVLFAAGAIPLAACRTMAGVDSGRPLRVATINIWHDMGDWPVRLPLLIRALGELDADVIALQEVLEDADRGLPNQARTIADALGLPTVRFLSTDAEGARRRYGNAILTRLPVLAEARRRLQPLDDYRTALRLRLDMAGGAIDVVCTHLAAAGDAVATRTRQIADLLSWLPDDDTPTIVMGDFNASLDESSLAPLRAAGLDSALPAGRARTTLDPTLGHAERVIDHIFADRPALTVTDARLFGDRATDGRYPSDHFGVTATLRRG